MRKKLSNLLRLSLLPFPLPSGKGSSKNIYLNPIMFNIALHIEYDGTAYHGFQRQTGLDTIQERLENAISQIANEPVQITCAGRTDAGVHATAQVINFHTQFQRDLRAWSVGVNRYLPNDIAVRRAFVVPAEFHARYSAIYRSYRYIINNHPLRKALGLGVHYPIPLDHVQMQQAANYLLGEHDFSAFRDADCQALTTLRKITFCKIQRVQENIYIDIQANAFLHHMVRNIVGTLVLIGRGRQPPIWMQQVLHSKDRRQAGATLAAKGLFLTGVGYAAPFHHLTITTLP